MNEIQEYRQKSAEALGFELEDHTILGKVYRKYDIELMIPIGDWTPDIDLNQMGMIEDWLTEQGVFITIIREDDLCTVIFYEELRGEPVMIQNETHESKPTAFMEAFMEYIKTKEQ